MNKFNKSIKYIGIIAIIFYAIFLLDEFMTAFSNLKFVQQWQNYIDNLSNYYLSSILSNISYTGGMLFVVFGGIYIILTIIENIRSLSQRHTQDIIVKIKNNIRKKNRSFKISFFCLANVLVMGGFYQAQGGQRLAPDGMLLEPFYLTVISFVFLFFTIVFLTAAIVRRFIGKSLAIKLKKMQA